MWLNERNARRMTETLGEKAHWVLLYQSEGTWLPARKGWNRPGNGADHRDVVDDVRNGCRIGLIPWSVGMAVIDIDVPDEPAMKAVKDHFGESAFFEKTPRGWHAWVPATESDLNSVGEGRWLVNGEHCGEFRFAKTMVVLRDPSEEWLEFLMADHRIIGSVADFHEDHSLLARKMRRELKSQPDVQGRKARKPWSLTGEDREVLAQMLETEAGQWPEGVLAKAVDVIMGRMKKDSSYASAVRSQWHGGAGMNVMSLMTHGSEVKIGEEVYASKNAAGAIPGINLQNITQCLASGKTEVNGLSLRYADPAIEEVRMLRFPRKEGDPRAPVPGEMITGESEIQTEVNTWINFGRTFAEPPSVGVTGRKRDWVFAVGERSETGFFLMAVRNRRTGREESHVRIGWFAMVPEDLRAR